MEDEQQQQQQQEECVSFSEMPEQVLLHVLKLLEGTELARMCATDSRLQHLASQQELWEKLAKAKWPQATAVQYGGDWQALFRHRVALPDNFVRCVDRCHELTARAAGKQQLRINSSSLPSVPSPASSPHSSPVKSNVYGFGQQRSFTSIPGMLFEQIMQHLFSLCLLHTRVSGSTNLLAAASSSSSGSSGYSSSSSGSYVSSSSAVMTALSFEMLLVREDSAWWLGHKPEAVFQFARRTHDLLNEFDMWGSGFSSWPEALWRRSALQFLSDLHLGPEMGVCLSVTSKLDRELQRLDDGIRSVDGEVSDLGTRPPQGLPPKHWWYACKGQMAGAIC